MPGFVPGPPIPHRPGIDDLAVKNLVVVGAPNRGLGRVSFAGVAWRAQQPRGGTVDAEIIGGSPVDHVLRIDRARKVIVQVSTLRHVMQKCQQQRWVASDRIEVARGFLLGSLCNRQGG